MMKIPSLFFALFLLLGTSSIFAGEVTYRASMTGIECAGCKKEIAKSLGKLKGVKTIRIEKGSGESHSLTVVADDSSVLSREDALKALGKNAPHYQLVSWTKSS